MFKKSFSSASGGIIDLVKTILYALALAGLIRTLLFQPFWIPSGSMKPNLLVGDFIFVNKFAYGYSKHSCPFSLCPIKSRVFGSEPVRGDIIVFRHPSNGKDFVKRLIGLPGDKVQLKDGRLYINEEPIPLQQMQDFQEKKEIQGPLGSIPRCSNEPVPFGRQCLKTQLSETLPNEVSYLILDIGENFGDNTPEFTVPDRNYFFLGDNRDNSLDSRFGTISGGAGFIPEEYLIGRVDRVMFSSAGRSMFFVWTWRFDRFLKAVT
ncbi:MAG: signal peptidase I [Pseudomonadota bacterium]|nr:signal peptidase I [Pseudomonadota bacterium]